MGRLLAHISASFITNIDLKSRLYGRFLVVEVHFYFHLVKQTRFELNTRSTRKRAYSHQAKVKEIAKNNK